MSVDKLVDSTQLNSDLTSIANAIRSKGGTSSSLSFPSGMVSAINDMTGEKYIGQYVVVPRANSETVLQTKDKSMSDNVTVREIPYYQTSNPQGGDTVYIGTEVL